MLLAVDIGNSNIVFGVYDGQEWLDKWRMHTDLKKMPDEYGVFFHQLLSEKQISMSSVKTAIISSVVPSLTGRIAKMIEKLSGTKPIIVGPGVKTGLTIRTENPAEVGSDLVANAVAAYQRFKKNCVIVDFGTALSFSAVTQKGEFLGAVFFPGIYTAAENLSAHTAQLPQVWLKQPQKVIGTNTIHSIQSGIVNGYVGTVEHLTKKIKEELGDAIIIATGGSADMVTPFTDVFTIEEPWLILEGLRHIASLNN